MPKPKFINKEFLGVSADLDVKKFAESVRGAFHDFIIGIQSCTRELQESWEK